MNRLEEIAMYAARGQYDRLVNAVVTRRDVDAELPKYKSPEGEYRRISKRLSTKYVRVPIPEDPFHLRTIIKNPYKKPYPFKGVNFP